MSKKLILIIIALVISSCSSGGGGGDSSNNNTVGARVLHGALEAAPVDLVSSVQGILQTTRFADNVGYAKLNSGTQVLNLYRSKDLSTPLLTRQINNDENQKHTIVFYGDRSEFGLRANLISEERPEVPDGSAYVRVIHAAVGAGSLEVPAASAVAAFGAASAYGAVAPGPKSFSILRSSDKSVVDTVSITAEEGKAYSIFVSGEVGYFVVSRVLEEN